VISLFIGGARSGKSEVAERCAARLPSPVTYVATCISFGECDPDMLARIAAHQARRPADWALLEVGCELPSTLHSLQGTALVDSLGSWIAACAAFDADAPALVSALGARQGDTVVVTEEVGLGVHPSTAIGGQFRDALGRVNQSVASVADEVWLVVAGHVLPLARGQW
jgi:adenosyl cobinamide kinase/adenosyl cobinamide phosphate guanylyltransferase